MGGNPIAFLSYVHFDDQYEGGRLTHFRERLSGEVRIQTGEPFEIFQDRNDIAWGQQWEKCIDNSLDAITFFIPVITPAFFKSLACREELERFLKREEDLGRNDLILPVYYIECAMLGDEAKRKQDPLAKVIADRQFVDWRELRFEPFSSPEVGKMLAQMALQIVKALERSHPLPAKSITAEGAITSLDTSQPIDAIDEVSKDTLLVTSSPIFHIVPKTEMPTIVVDGLYRGDYSNLTEALSAAKPGTRILIRPGYYKESILINKPVEIVGDGEKYEVIIESGDGHTLVFQSSMGRIANLTLRQTDETNQSCVDIRQGKLDLEGCDITSQGDACVAIHDGADPRLRNNRIHHGKEVGILIYNNGKGTLEDNDIFANEKSAVHIASGSNPTLRRNLIHHGKYGGVSVYDNGKGTLEDNNIFSNTHAGVFIFDGADPTLRRNRIYDGKESGIFVYDNGKGTLEDNDIFANEKSGVIIKAGGDPTLRRNRIHKCKRHGISIEDNGKGTLEDNDIFANEKSGVLIGTGSNPTLRRNHIHGCKSYGVNFSNNGHGILEENFIFNNEKSGVAIGTGSNPTLRRNRISNNYRRASAVYVHIGGKGIFEKNDLDGDEIQSIDATIEKLAKKVETPKS